MTTPEIEELKSLVEQKYGKILATTTDFEEFSLYLEKKASGTISPSTLKRLYGYVSDNHKPRMVTLDVLSQYYRSSELHGIYPLAQDKHQVQQFLLQGKPAGK